MKQRQKRRVRRRRRRGPVQLLLPLQMPLVFDVAFLSRPMPPPFVDDPTPRFWGGVQASLFS